jgi:hypothetical protein
MREMTGRMSFLGHAELVDSEVEGNDCILRQHTL